MMEVENMHITPCELNMREMECEMNILSRSDGSALLSQGETVVLASVSGPIEVKLQNLSIEKAIVEVHYRPKFGFSGINDRLKEKIIRETCESALLTTLHPRTAVSIQLQEMEDRAGLIACAINAACLALINSGFPMKFLIAAIHCVIDHENELILDPNHKQIKNSKASLTLVIDSVDLNAVTSYTTGKFTQEQYLEALLVCKEASNQIFLFYRNIVKKFTKIL